MSKTQITLEGFKKGKEFILELPKERVINYLKPLIMHGITEMEAQTTLIGLYIITKQGTSEDGYANITPEDFRKFLLVLKQEAGL